MNGRQPPRYKPSDIDLTYLKFIQTKGEIDPIPLAEAFNLDLDYATSILKKFERGCYAKSEPKEVMIEDGTPCLLRYYTLTNEGREEIENKGSWKADLQPKRPKIVNTAVLKRSVSEIFLARRRTIIRNGRPYIIRRRF